MVEQTASEFFEARVLEVGGQNLRVQTTEGDSVHVSAGDVYAVRGSPKLIEAGALGICRVRPGHWVGCRVESAVRGVVKAWDESGASLTLDTAHFIVPTAVTKLNLERRFEMVKKQAEFRAAVRRAGPPVVEQGWKPALHEKVVARHGADWFSGRIRDIGDDSLRVAWDADGRLSELPRSAVVPQPGPESTVLRGSYGLLRPDGPAQPWQPIRVVAGSGEELVVVDAQGHRHRVHPRDILSLGPA